MPFKKALEFNSKNENKIAKITTYIKINSFIARYLMKFNIALPAVR